MTLRPVTPVSPCGPPMTNFPVGFKVQQVVVADKVGQLVARPLQACL